MVVVWGASSALAAAARDASIRTAQRMARIFFMFITPESYYGHLTAPLLYRKCAVSSIKELLNFG